MAVCVARTPCARLEGEEACSLCPSPKTASGHRLGRDPLRHPVVATTISAFLCSCYCLPAAGASGCRARSEGTSVAVVRKGGCHPEDRKVRRCGWQQQAPLDWPTCRPVTGSQRRRDTCARSLGHGCTAPCAVCTSRVHVSGNPGQAWRSRDMGCAPCAKYVCPAHDQPWSCGSGDPVSGSV